MAKISVVGTGYVGLCTGVGFTAHGHTVICVDLSREKVDKINSGIPPIFENGLEQALKKAVSAKKLSATTSLDDAIANSEITFIAVGTPSHKDGSIDLSQVIESSKQIANTLESKKDYHVVVMKSTVLPSTTDNILVRELARTKKIGQEVGVAMNPEFLREGRAVEDFLQPDRIVIGEYDKKSGDAVEKIYKDFKSPVIRTTLKTAEMIKYASNSLLATKISFANETGNMCKQLGIDTYEVMRAVGMDHRTGPHFLDAGSGFGGSCFPKDVSALVAQAKEIGIAPQLLESVLNINEKQKLRIVDLLERRLQLRGRRVAVLGLAFKAGTDDIRDSVAISVIGKLLEKGASVAAYDPAAEENMKHIYARVEYCKSAKDALRNADACLILTEWEEFAKLTDKDFAAMNNRIIIEGRRVLDKNKVHGYEGICW